MAGVTKSVCKFYKKGRCWFGDRCKYSHPLNEFRKARQMNDIEVKMYESKKMPPGKTAWDVLRWIQRDEDWPKKHFIVGFSDGFEGVEEEPFRAFDWLDNQTVIAIPEHRIQYFKYRHRKVWDKNERLDLIFGSTSLEGKTIVELLRSFDEELLFQEDLFTVIPDDNGEPDFHNFKPTHFLAFQIDDPELVNNLEETMSELLVTDSVVPRVNSKLYHVTLGLLSLEHDNRVSYCVRVMTSYGIDFFAGAPQFVQFSGIGSYGERVLFARVTEDCRLNEMVSNLLLFLKGENVRLQERPFEFHMTLLKDSNFMATIDHGKLTAMCDRNFGQQPLRAIHLCAMHEPPGDDGSYRIISSIQRAKIPD